MYRMICWKLSVLSMASPKPGVSTTVNRSLTPRSSISTVDASNWTVFFFSNFSAALGTIRSVKYGKILSTLRTQTKTALFVLFLYENVPQYVLSKVSVFQHCRMPALVSAERLYLWGLGAWGQGFCDSITKACTKNRDDGRRVSKIVQNCATSFMDDPFVPISGIYNLKVSFTRI